MAYRIFPSTQPRFADRPCRIALFDLDGTLIVSKSGKRWAADGDDVVFRGPVPAVLQRYATEGWTVAIVSNQSEISRPRTETGPLTKINAVLNALFEANAWAPWCLVACGPTTETTYRKPARGLYDVLLKELESPTVVEVMMCGDAVGPAASQPEYRWSDSDAAFAAAIGATFHTPDAVFGSTVAAPLCDGGTELVLNVGNMGSGKSTSARRLAATGYIHCEQDVLGNARAVLRAAADGLASGKSVVVDASHSTAEHRAPYIALGRKMGVPVRILWHIRDGRPYNALRDKPVPEVAYAVYSKRFEDPLLDGVTVEQIY
jgi:DNA 3'-phosphatase